jgi:hypothetical protein
MTKFFMQMIPPMNEGQAVRWSKQLVGKKCVTADTLERRSRRSKYTGEVLREIRADGKHV